MVEVSYCGLSVMRDGLCSSYTPKKVVLVFASVLLSLATRRAGPPGGPPTSSSTVTSNSFSSARASPNNIHQARALEAAAAQRETDETTSLSN